MSLQVAGDAVVSGSLAVVGGISLPAGQLVGANLSPVAEILRTQLKQETGAPYVIPLTEFRVHDALDSFLPGTSSADDLSLDGGTFGTSGACICTSDLKAAGSTTRYARVRFALPAEYDAGQTVILRATAGMITTIADTSCTLDAEVYQDDGDTTISADLNVTNALSMNSLTFASKDFSITATSLASGSVLDIRLAVACNDAATVTEVKAAIGRVELLLDIRG